METQMTLMNLMSATRPIRVAALAALVCVAATGCKQTSGVDDATLQGAVQQRIGSDSGLTNEPVQTSVIGGTVTLSGGVSSNAARSLAANDAAAVKGVKQVINNIVVGAVSATVTTPAEQVAPIPSSVAPMQAPARVRVAPAPAPVMRQPPPAQVVHEQAPPPPPPGPVFRNITLQAGSTIPVRVTQTLDSANAQIGDPFSGAVAVDIIQDGMLLIPRGASVTGRVTQVHEASHFAGSSLLTVELTGVTARGERLSVATSPYSVEGKGRGKNTAEKAGIGAAAGAILGGVFGGGKGAAIGAAAGGGTGVGINAVTRGQQVQIPTETVVRFQLTNPITVRTSTAAGASQDQGLQTRY